jgi:signal transduction histidine kinase/ligand-binding sensor domain-containing protein
LVDSSGRLWIWTEDPNTIVIYEQGHFRAFVKGTDFNADYIYDYSIEDDGLHFQSGADIYVYSEGKFERRPSQRVKLPKVSYDLNSGLAWIRTNDGYYALKGTQSTFYPRDAEPTLDRRKLTPADYIEMDGGLWLVVPFSPVDFRLSFFRDGQLKTSSVRIQTLRFLTADRQNNFWLGDFYDGIRKITAASIRNDDLSQLKVERFLQANGLVSNYLATMLVDRDGNIWIGTDKGLQLLIDEPPVTVYSKASGLPAENTYSIVQDKAGTIWFGAWDNHLVKYANDIFTPELKKWVQALFVDRDGRLWVGASEGIYASPGIYYRDSDSSNWSSLYDQLRIPVADQIMVTVISQDRNGDMWFGGVGGITRYQRGQFKTFRVADGLPDSEVTSFLQTSSGTIWVGTKIGLAQLVDEKLVALKSQNQVLHTFVRSLYEDHDGTLWIGTYDSGLFRYKNSSVVNINSANGLFSDGVFCILEDDDGWFWMNSNQGIYRVKRDELNSFADGQLAIVNSVSYGPDDGLHNVEGNGGKQPAGLKASDGTLWFPTAGGVAVIDPRKATRNSGPLQVLIEDVRVDENDVEPQSGVIQLPPDQSTLDITYTAMSFVGPDRVRFRYRLEGLDANWIDAGSRRVAYFSHLPYGEYTFRVIAANADGAWNNSGATIRLVILSPFYRRAWFYALVALGLFSVLAAMYAYRLRQLKAINAARADFTRRLIDSQENERRRIALELHDSLGQSLAVIRNRALMSLNRPHEHERVLDQMQEISEASAAALQEAREIAYNLHPGQIEHLGLPTALTTLVESVQGGTSIQFETRIEQLQSKVSKDQAINIYRIAQESLSNLIKHSSADQAMVALYQKDGRLYLSVEDDGRGIPTRRSNGGLGLKGIASVLRLSTPICKSSQTVEKGHE